MLILESNADVEITIARFDTGLKRQKKAWRLVECPDFADVERENVAEDRGIVLTNTMGRKLERFEPTRPGRVRLYTCGPTVYSFAHIGNFRAYIVADTLRRMLEYNGYAVEQVRNITDVGHLTHDEAGAGPDKVEEAARKLHRTPWEIAEEYTRVFLADSARLNIEQPEHAPRATEYIEPMVALVQRLIDAGKAYVSDGSVYFDVSAFPNYGNLSGNTIDGLIAGARVEVEQTKRSPADFALWKAAGQEKIMRWPSPWGEGVPGWHLECSAMAMDLLGDQIDIHTGGVDHIFPHHEDEIAQSEGATGQRFSRFWLHNAFLQLPDDEKMSKSLGNIYTVSDLIDRGIYPLAYRYFTFQAHYRTPLSFSWEALEGAQTALMRVWEAVAEARQTAVPEDLSAQSQPYRSRFQAAINRDLDLPGAVAVLHEVIASSLPPGQKLGLLADFDRVLALDLLAMGDKLSSVSTEEQTLLAERAEARKARNWSRSDELRARLAGGGLAVKDTPDGQRWVRTDVLPSGDGGEPE